jgi:hypothetical protein
VGWGNQNTTSWEAAGIMPGKRTGVGLTYENELHQYLTPDTAAGLDKLTWRVEVIAQAITSLSAALSHDALIMAGVLGPPPGAASRIVRTVGS